MQGDRRIIFVGGVHGVGKTSFTSTVEASLNISSFSASELICKYKLAPTDQHKRVADIDQNQSDLLCAIAMYTRADQPFLLDGHFCLLDSKGEIQRIQPSVFQQIRPRAIILLQDEPALILERQRSRDGRCATVEFIAKFQAEEEAAAKKVSLIVGVPLLITSPTLNEPVSTFIKNHLM